MKRKFNLITDKDTTMHKIFTIILVILCTNIFGQQICQKAVSQHEYVGMYQQIKDAPNDKMKLNRAKQFLHHHCFNSVQIKTLLELFIAEFMKLEFAKAAYFKAVDKKNYYDVYDAFAYFSTAFKLYDFISRQEQQHHSHAHEENQLNIQYNFPTYNYPKAGQYLGSTGCDYPLSDQDFYRLLVNFNAGDTYQNSVRKAIAIASNNCLSVSQYMKMCSMIKNLGGAYSFLTTCYKFVYDQQNYPETMQILRGTAPYYNDYMMFLGSLNKPVNAPALPMEPNGQTENLEVCTVSYDEFIKIKNSIKKQTFDNTKVTVIKQVLQAKKCFNSVQIKSLVKMMSFESAKLDVAKFAYQYCIDKENYYKINDAFDFASSIRALDKYILEQN